MNRLSKFIIIIISFSFVLLSCVGVNPTDESVAPIPIGDNAVTSPVLVGEAAISPLAPPKAVVSPTLTPKPYPTYELCEQTSPNFQITFPTEENGLTEPKIVYIPDPTCTKEWYATIEAKAAEEQAAVATARAYLGDKSPNVKIKSIRKRSSQSGYRIALQQIYQGIPIDGATGLIFVEPDVPPRGDITYYSNVHLPSITPTITRDEVIPIAVNRIGIQGDYRIVYKPWLVVDDVSRLGEPSKFVLRWRVVLGTNCPLGDWFVQINAYTGDVLSFHDTIKWDPAPPTDRKCPTPLPVKRPTRIPAP